MAFNANGIRRIDYLPNPAGTAGENRSLWGYLTNDDTAAVETAGYFTSHYPYMKKGDIIMCSLDLDGTAMLRNYIVSASSSSAVSITAQDVS
jgi:hypothetical protein